MPNSEHIPTMPQTGTTEHIPTMPQTGTTEHIPTMPQTGTTEHIPTMPQTGTTEHIPTMPQTNSTEHIATMPQTGTTEHIPTMPQTNSTEHIATIPQSDSDDHISTVPQNGQTNNKSSDKRLLYTEIEFTAENGESYIIFGNNPVSTDTGEAQIYKCCKKDEMVNYVAKVLINLRPDSAPGKLITRNKVIRFLEKYSTDPQYHILPLIAHGVLRYGGHEYFTDIYPFCAGGDLGSKVGEMSLDMLKRDVIPSINDALNIFHKEGFVHRDLKPDNLFMYNNEIVIGDFGITCELNTDKYAVDTEKIGTLGYFAPELMAEAAITASDYYAMGQTIWTLYHGEMMYRDAIRSHGGFFSADARNTVSDLMRKNNFPGLDEIEKKDEFFEVLIRGLLLYDTIARFGYDEVCMWLNDDMTLYPRVKMLRGDEIFEKPVTINGKDCIDNNQVAEQLMTSWKDSLEFLYSGELANRYEYTLGRKEEALVVSNICKTCVADNDNIILRDIGLCRVIMYLSEKSSLVWRNNIFRKPSDISTYMSKKLSDEEYKSMLELIRTGLVEEWLVNTGNDSDVVINEIRKLIAISRYSVFGAHVAFFWMYYMLMENRNEGKYLESHNLDDIVKKLLSGPDELYLVFGNVCAVENAKLIGFLCSKGYDESMMAFIENNCGENTDYKRLFEMLFDFFENNVTDSEILKTIRSSYHKFGPQAYLIWWKNHIDSYKFFGNTCKTIKENVASITVNAESDIASQRTELMKLAQEYKLFMEYFRFDYILGLCGIRKHSGKECIYSGKLSCVLGYNFLQQIVPIGFKYELKI